MRRWQRWLTTALLGGTLAANIVGHRTGWWLTLCTNTRRYCPPGAFLAFWAALTAFLVPHYIRGFRDRA